MSARLTRVDLEILRDMWEHDACTAEIDRLTDERDTHAETLRVLLLREATEWSETGMDQMATSKMVGSYEEIVADYREGSGVSYANAGIALILALMIGGE